MRSLFKPVWADITLAGQFAGVLLLPDSRHGLHQGRRDDDDESDEKQKEGDRYDPVGQGKTVLEEVSDLQNAPCGAQIYDEDSDDSGALQAVPGGF